MAKAKEVKYGRGKFDAHPTYVKYMGSIVDNPAYAEMPNVRSEDGHINWQVSSGKSTSFYKYYEARFAWWVNKADEMSVKGSGNSDDRFSITARIIHPSGWRPCRLCGQERNVGYFYTNHLLTKKLNLILGEEILEKATPLPTALEVLSESLSNEDYHKILNELFPERKEHFVKYGYTQKAFEKSNYLRSKWLSPGYMCNPPDRLDGFHDYCIMCREKNDPGRSRANLASYLHDRRVFELWSEGDWLVADKLYSFAGSGQCYMCGKSVDKISPDHVGPLACGFKQLPLFMPTCQACNSSKNRRLSCADVKRLIDYEASSGESVASWQIRKLWDANKSKITDDRQAKELSDILRALQDIYIRVLHSVYKDGLGGVLTILLHPEYAAYKVEFKDLDPATLTYASFSKTPFESKLRVSLAGRSVRIAFEELDFYAEKDFGDRKLRKVFQNEYNAHVSDIVNAANTYRGNKRIKAWGQALSIQDFREKQSKISLLLEQDRLSNPSYPAFKKAIEDFFNRVGNNTYF